MTTLVFLVVLIKNLSISIPLKCTFSACEGFPVWKAVRANLKDKAAGILLVLTFIQLPFTIFRNTGYMSLAIIGGAAAGLVLLFVVIRHIFRPTLLRKFGVPASSADPILVSKKELVEVDREYKAVISTEKTLLFLTSPREDDLVDTFDLTPDLELDASIYNSPDSTIIKKIRVSPNRLAVYWRPTKDIVINGLTTHKTRTPIPDKYGDDAFFQANYIDLRTGTIEWRFDCPAPVVEASATILPAYVKNITYPRLYRLFSKGHEYFGEQPTISPDGLHIEWMLRSPQRWRTYVLMAFYAGGKEKFMADCEARYARVRLMNFFEDILKQWRTYFYSIYERASPHAGKSTKIPSNESKKLDH